MGDYSRNTFSLTNVMHQVLNGGTVDSARQYVGVRLQQGVPLLDADWNEMDEIRRIEMRALAKYFFGDGVPENNSGLAISGSGADNDFTINTGVAIVDGQLVFVPEIVTYLSQTQAANLPPLTTPAVGSNRRDLVYLDVWEEEVSAVLGSSQDERLINPDIGIETATRILRRWAVRVLEGVGGSWNIPAPTDDNIHHYMELAIIQRRENVATISDSMIIDRRKTGLTVADYLKVPLLVSRGLEVVNRERYGQMLANLRNVLFGLFRDGEIPIATDAENSRAESIIHLGFQQLLHLNQVGENQALAGNLNNLDALVFLGKLYEEQNAWLNLLSDLGNEGGVADSFIEQYRLHLHGPIGDQVSTLINGGLLPALESEDLLLAVLAQEELNGSFGDLFSGSVSVSYSQAIPFDELLAAGSEVAFIFDVRSFFPSGSTETREEDFNVEVLLDEAFGSFTIDRPVLTMESPSDDALVTINVMPSGTITSASFDVLVRSTSNPNIVSPQNPITLTLGEQPPVANFYIYSGPRFNVDGFFAVPRAALPLNLVSVQTRLENSSLDEIRTVDIDVRLEVDSGNISDWNWTGSFNSFPPQIIIDPQDRVNVNVLLAWTGAGTPAAGITGRLFCRATTQIGDTTESQIVTVPFVLV